MFAPSSAATRSRSSTTNASPGARTTMTSGRGSPTAARTSRPERPGCGDRERWSARSTSCSWTRPARSRSPTSSRSRGRRRASSSSAIPSSSTSRCGARIRRVPTGRPSPTSSAGAATMPPDRGLFLETTWRLHPQLCAFTSEVFYDDRLEPEPHLVGQRVDARGATIRDGVGPRLLEVPTVGADNESPEEADEVARVARSLVEGGATWIDQKGERAAGRRGTRSSSSRRTTPRSARSSAACRRRRGSAPSTSSRARRRPSASTR